jgi:glycosyltransferase involved in cell wall biosynthesis
MRVLIVTDQFPPAHFGGMAQHAYHAARYLSRRHEVLVATLRAHDPSGHAAEQFMVRPLLTKRFPSYDFRLIRRLARSIKADVVHACTAGLVDGTTARCFPVVTRTVGNDFLRPWCGYNLPLRSVLYRLPGQTVRDAVGAWESAIRKARVIRYLRAGALTGANSRWTRDRLVDRGVAEDHIRVVVGGVDTGVFRPAHDRRAVRERLGIPLEAPVVVTAGNLVGKKGFDTVLRALALLREERPFYVVVGDGPEGKHLRDLAAGLVLRDRVIFEGPKTQNELARYYQAADVYVLASQEETMGRTYFEAGACGIPVIGARVGGVPDVVEHERNGLLIDDPEDVEALAACLRRVLADPVLRQRLGAAGLERARTEFSWEAVGRTFEGLLEDAVEAFAGARSQVHLR